MFEDPVLIYSEYCDYSKRFIKLMSQHQQIEKRFVFLNIDVDPATRSRPDGFYRIQEILNYKITEVPTIVVEQGQYVLSGEEAFKWLEYTISRFKDEDVGGFNPNEMGAFSDQYSNFGSNDMNGATDQSYRFINREYDSIETPPEDSRPITADDLNKKQAARSNVNIPRNKNNLQTPPNINQNISFSKSNYKNSRGNIKQNEVEKRLEDLMAQREQFTPKIRPPKDIDFTTGRIIK